MKGKLILAAAICFAVAGCSGGGDSVRPNSPDEQKALDSLKTLTPQQQIDRINSGPMPQAAKDTMIKKIKADNNMK